MPTPQAVQAAQRLERQVDWSEDFWLGYVFTIDANQADFIRLRAANRLEARGSTLKVIQPNSPAELGLEGIIAHADAGCVWVEAIREPDAQDGAWADAWMQLILRTNERREFLRSRLAGGLVLVMHPALKPDARAAGPDLWSIRSLVFELPAGTPSPLPSGLLDRVAWTPRSVDAELLERDLVRWSDLQDATRPVVEQALTLLELGERLRDASDPRAHEFGKDALAYVRAHATEVDDRLLARALEARAFDLEQLGDGAAAIELLDEAVALRRADSTATDHELVLAHTLFRLGVLAGSLGQFERAGASLVEVVDRLRQLDMPAPTLDAAELLAAAFGQLGLLMLAYGNLDAALQMTRRAEAAIRRFASDGHVRFTPVLAGTLSNLSTILSALGRPQEALEAASEALEIFGELPSHSADLARALYNYGLLLGRLGRRSEANQAIREAVDILDRLVASGDQSLRSMLATVLAGQAGSLRELGIQDAAHTAAARAVGILRELTEREGGHTHELAVALNSLGLVSTPDTAYACFTEAVELLRPLVSSGRFELGKDLAGYLTNQSISLAHQDGRDAAIDAAREAVEIQRELANVTGLSINEHLGCALNNLSVRLGDAGQYAEAIEIAREAVAIFRAAEQPFTEGLSPDIASALGNLGNQLSASGDYHSAVPIASEAVELRRQLAERFPEAERGSLAADLVNLGASLLGASKIEPALSATREAIEIYRELVQTDADVYSVQLANALHNLARQLLKSEDWPAMREAAQEAVSIRRTLGESVRSKRQLAQSLALLAAACAQLGEADEAAAALECALLELPPSITAEDPLRAALTQELLDTREGLRANAGGIADLSPDPPVPPGPATDETPPDP